MSGPRPGTSLTPEQWSSQTDCPAWDVRQLACHVLGMAAYASSIREGRRQQRLAHKALATHGGGEFIDQLTDLQVRERAALTPAQITQQFHAIGRGAAKGRRRTPAIIRRHRMPEPQTIGGISEWWSIGFVTDVILTRDVWMHRVDLSRAIGRPLRLSADHDGELIADMAREWAGRHGQPFRLHLTGPVGGAWSSGTDGETLEVDALEFCRILSGREPGNGLLATPVPF
ncbi:maleylpyruvate isomerase family mycothiol-dependent enzyme [Rhodococcus opacus]|uniref:maleylpyruvate isomerase family mycothiol-dependent enzyme n=1 Tax=Rhodococcus opacus TaxID=37919 RepID=UPI003AF71061